MQATIILMSKSERHAIRDEQSVPVQLRRIVEAGWLHRLYALIASYSLKFRLANGDAVDLRNAAEVWCNDKKLSDFASLEASTLSVSAVLQAFTRFEECLRSRPTSSAYKASASFRKFFFKHIPRLGAPHITVRGVNFKTRLPTKSKRRKLISDFAGVLPPAGATPHENVKELIGKVHERLQADLRNIRKAAMSDLEAGERVRAYLTKCLEQEVDIELLEAVQRATRYSARKDLIPNFKSIPIEEYIAALQISFAANGWGERDGPTVAIAYGNEVNEHIRAQARCGSKSNRLIESLNYAAAYEIHSAITVLQVHTGWNIKSLLDLQSSDIKKTSSGYEIQSTKTKTDDLTPVAELQGEQDQSPDTCLITDADEDEIRALNLLTWNHEQAIALGQKARDDERLFFCVRARREDGKPILQQMLKSFCERHRLKPFSHEQIRTQVVNSRNFRGLEYTSLRAGHVSISTTGGYLDQEIWQRLNSSINLEYQRRLDDELQWKIGREANRPRTLLLRPIGDGTSCADIHNPPHNDIDADGICNAVACHLDGGCRNRRVIITERRMQEIALHENVYQENWEELLSENRHKFLKYHVPAIALNRALVRLCEEGPYAHLYAKARKQVIA